MHSIAFFFGSKPIHWYGICIALGFLAALALLQYNKKYARMTSDQIFDIGIIAVFCGIVGARAFYVVQFWNQFRGNLSDIVRIDKGGLVFYGGFLFALFILWRYSKRKKLSLARILDIYGPAMAIGHAFGRIGCFMQGCCFGKPAANPSFGVVFPPGSAPAARCPDLLSMIGETAGKGLSSLPLYPTQLYESAANFALGILLLALIRRVKKVGQVAAAYFASYGLIRFFLEFLRGDHTDRFLGMTQAQNIGLFLMLPLGLFFFIYFGRKGEDAYPIEKTDGSGTV